MYRRTIIAVPLIAFAAAGAVFAPGSFGQGQAAPTTLTLEMRHREARVTMIDEAPRMTRRLPSESPGDSVVSRGTLRGTNGFHAGARVGVLHAQFVVTGGRSPDTTEQVVSTFVLDHGQLAVQGVVDQEGDSEIVPIVGGTGRYDGARGSVEITGDDKAVQFELRFRQGA